LLGSFQSSDALETKLERVLLVLYSGFLFFSFGLFAELATDCGKLLKKNLLSMHGSLSLNVSHDLAALSQVQLSPVLNIHLEDIRLRELRLCSRDHLEVRLAQKGRHCCFLVLEATLKRFESLLYGFLLLLVSLSQYYFELLRSGRWLSSSLFSFCPLFSQLLSLLRGDILILEMLAVLIPELLALIHDCQQAGHGEADLDQVRVAVELLG
jgi:hypothetical protein